ncbi:hypothetical protein L6164_026033 [Bauhinia variegata]|uniref:Uncharacterized protein n=1 Tax=Bauhinia variegata TaxID=167791 RepID=A0ACB9M695_BAUVA|nr:hypothetical protein L6164_026033 [Bauhinia variegata]
MASQDHQHIFQWHFIDINHSNFHSYGQGLFLILLFFTILFFITTLSLCVHFCRRRLTGSAATASPAPLPACQWIGVVDYTYIKSPVSMSAKSLEVEAGFERSQCCICLSVFQEDEKLKVLPECGHSYHSECLEKWLSANPSCPLCRASLLQVNSMGKLTISNSSE